MKTHQEMLDDFLKNKSITKIETVETDYTFNKSRRTRVERDRDSGFIAVTKKGIMVQPNGDVKVCFDALKTVSEYQIGDQELLKILKKIFTIAKCDYFGNVKRYCFDGKRLSELQTRRLLQTTKYINIQQRLGLLPPHPTPSHIKELMYKY